MEGIIMARTKNQIRAALCKNAVKRLLDCYPGVNERNIMTNSVYRNFFREILSNKLRREKNANTRAVIVELMELLLPLKEAPK
jgi:Tfp pilus assembly pilus retraction ATPase PilT